MDARCQGREKSSLLEIKKSSIFIEDFFCGASWIRTSDTRIFSPLLYQLSYGTLLLNDFQSYVLLTTVQR